MARRKKEPDGQLSLFSDADFDIQPRQEEKPRPTPIIVRMEKPKSPIPKTEDKEKGKAIGKRDLKDEKIMVRGKRLRLRITFEDGTVFRNASATQTMIETIRKIGVRRVAELGMEVCHIPLVAQEINQKYAPWIKEIGDGWYLMAQSDTKQKYMQMSAIISQLSIGVKVELGNFDALEAAAGSKPDAKPKKKKAQLEVKIGDKTFTHGSDTVYTFLDVAEAIGVDKMKMTNIKVGKFNIITHDKVANNQIQTSTGEWLTVPTQIKDKYKVLRVMSSMTRTPMEIKITE